MNDMIKWELNEWNESEPYESTLMKSTLISHHAHKNEIYTIKKNVAIPKNEKSNT